MTARPRYTVDHRHPGVREPSPRPLGEMRRVRLLTIGQDTVLLSCWTYEKIKFMTLFQEDPFNKKKLY